MSCECDITLFPTPLSIAAGGPLARQIATFPEWRQAILAAIGRDPLLDDWAAREPGDLGLMCVEWWAYVCDVTSFYDQAIAEEMFVRTAQLAGSTRRLVELLGYVPRPAVAASAVLAVIAEGRKRLKIPAGTAFRSGEFPGSAPQVFELLKNTLVHPLNNRWPIQRIVPTTVGTSAADVTLDSLLLVPGTDRVSKGDIVVLHRGADLWARRVAAVTPTATAARDRFVRVDFDSPITLSGTTTWASLELLTPSTTARPSALSASGDEAAVQTRALVLDGLHRLAMPGQIVVLEQGSSLQALFVNTATEQPRTLLTGLKSNLFAADGTTPAGVLESPDIKVQVTKLDLSAAITGVPTVTSLVVHYGFTRAGRIAVQPRDTLLATDPIQLDGAFEGADLAPSGLLFEDVNDDGVSTTGTLDVASRVVSIDEGTAWPTPLHAPVSLYGNAVTVTRGESVHGELLGRGDASLAFQTFKLQKKPLTYLPASDPSGATGLTSTLEIRVDGVRWHETSTFFGAADTDRVYTVRQDEQGNSIITFGGGTRLPTGSVVTADYRFGAGAASPPAGSIAQLVKPVPGIKSVHNPLAAFGGADAEAPAELRAYAPRSALLLGRAVSLLDFEAAAAAWPGVRAAAVEWQYSEIGQRPMIHAYFIGDAQLATPLRARLQQLSDSTTPIRVEPAVADATHVEIDVDMDPDVATEGIVAGVTQSLFASATTPGTGGLLRPEMLGVGRALYMSRVEASVLSVAGARAVNAIRVNGAVPKTYGIKPQPGHYFDIEQGGLLVNGVAAHV